MTQFTQIFGDRYHAVFLFVYGDFPHPCFFCGEEVDGHTKPRDRFAAVIHHIDHDPKNNAPVNLAPAHHGCHAEYHRSSEKTREKMRAASQKRFERDGPLAIGFANRGRKHTPTELAKMSAAAMGKPKSATHRANIAAARKGLPSPFQGKHSQESIEKMRLAAMGRPKACCVSCRRELGVNNLQRHVCRSPSDRKVRVTLSSDQQAEVCARWQNGEKQVDLAAEYGVSQPYISTIVRRLAKERSLP